MLYIPNMDVATAAQQAINQLPEEPEGVGGLIALDANGHHAFGLSKNSHMYRGWVTRDGKIYVQILAVDPPKLIQRQEKK